MSLNQGYIVIMVNINIPKDLSFFLFCPSTVVVLTPRVFILVIVRTHSFISSALVRVFLEPSFLVLINLFRIDEGVVLHSKHLMRLGCLIPLHVVRSLAERVSSVILFSFHIVDLELIQRYYLSPLNLLLIEFFRTNPIC